MPFQVHQWPCRSRTGAAGPTPTQRSLCRSRTGAAGPPPAQQWQQARGWAQEQWCTAAGSKGDAAMAQGTELLHNLGDMPLQQARSLLPPSTPQQAATHSHSWAVHDGYPSHPPTGTRGVQLDPGSTACWWQSCTVRGLPDGTLIYKFGTVDDAPPYICGARSARSSGQHAAGYHGNGVGRHVGGTGLEAPSPLPPGGAPYWSHALWLTVKPATTVGVSYQKLAQFVAEHSQGKESAATLSKPMHRSYAKALRKLERSAQARQGRQRRRWNQHGRWLQGKAEQSQHGEGAAQKGAGAAWHGGSSAGRTETAALHAADAAAGCFGNPHAGQAERAGAQQRVLEVQAGVMVEGNAAAASGQAGVRVPKGAARGGGAALASLRGHLEEQQPGEGGVPAEHAQGAGQLTWAMAALARWWRGAVLPAAAALARALSLGALHDVLSALRCPHKSWQQGAGAARWRGWGPGPGPHPPSPWPPQVEGAHVLPLVDKLLTSRGPVDKALLAACGFHPTGRALHPLADLPAWRVSQLTGHPVGQLDLYRKAFTHVTALPIVQSVRVMQSYERLEWLGDSVLELVVRSLLMDKFPAADEGQLSLMSRTLVSGRRAHEYASFLGLDKWVVMGARSMRGGAHKGAAVLADVFEALVGALYQDQGFASARKFVCRVLGRCIEWGDLSLDDDHRTALSRWASTHSMGSPRYKLARFEWKKDSRTGLRRQYCTVEVELGGRQLGQGTHWEKAYAERQAAGQALKALHHGYKS